MTEQKTKVPAQLFQWFDSLKQGYEHSINKLFNRVEQVNEDHKQEIKTVYQAQIDGLKKSYQDHLQSLKSSHQAQSEQAERHTRQLQKDAAFYQDQVKRQNLTIDKLNDRYDAVIFALKDKMDHKELEHVIKDISPAKEQPQELKSPTPPQTGDEPDTPAEAPAEAPEKADQRLHDETTAPATNTDATGHETKSTPNPYLKSDDRETDVQAIVNQAFEARQNSQFEVALDLFAQAARLGDEKSMGAIGRAYFVGEGVPADKTTGLAWLILAAENQFEPAINKVASAEKNSPQLYHNADLIARQLL